MGNFPQLELGRSHESVLNAVAVVICPNDHSLLVHGKGESCLSSHQVNEGGTNLRRVIAAFAPLDVLREKAVPINAVAGNIRAIIDGSSESVILGQLEEINVHPSLQEPSPQRD